MAKPDFSSSQQPLEPEIGLLARKLIALIIAGRRCQREIQGALQQFPLTDSQLLVLWMVRELCPQTGGEGVGQSDLVRTLGISAAQISGLVDQLRRSKDLIGARAEQDRRQQLWQLTTAGEEKLIAALAVVAELNGSFLEELSPEYDLDLTLENSSVKNSFLATAPAAHREAA